MTTLLLLVFANYEYKKHHKPAFKESCEKSFGITGSYRVKPRKKR